MIKSLKFIYSLISEFKTKLAKQSKEQKKVSEINIHKNLQSNELQKKLALLINNIENVDQVDLKNVDYKKMDTESNKDLFTSYRLDFHTRDELNQFRKKYLSLLL